MLAAAYQCAASGLATPISFITSLLRGKATSLSFYQAPEMNWPPAMSWAGYYNQNSSDRKETSEERPLLRIVVEDGARAERGRYRLFVGNNRAEIDFGFELGGPHGRSFRRRRKSSSLSFVASLYGVERPTRPAPQVWPHPLLLRHRAIQR